MLPPGAPIGRPQKKRSKKKPASSDDKHLASSDDDEDEHLDEQDDIEEGDIEGEDLAKSAGKKEQGKEEAGPQPRETIPGEAVRTYIKMWYKEGNAWGIRRRFYDKAQAFQLGERPAGFRRIIWRPLLSRSSARWKLMI